jgi:hypothetical protein
MTPWSSARLVPTRTTLTDGLAVCPRSITIRALRQKQVALLSGFGGCPALRERRAKQDREGEEW